ncbi:hypothetical protein [Phenylobacterium kunshanense]|uniref:hypothetical protein n=1 Tax=Phenylobacterium kunshanense TaxID=1445034 RepID=UPI0010582FE0|nr:hypothetical protein [Phenylobacterium kunshanense]
MTSVRAPECRRWPAWLAAAAALWAPDLRAAPSPPPPQSGIYESLVLAIAADGTLTGHFREQLGSRPVRECAFFLSGRDGQVVAWSAGEAGVIRGRLTPDGAGVTLTLAQVRDLPGCASVLSPDAGDGLRLERTQGGDWRGLAVVAAPRARLYPSATASRSTAYVVAGDVLAVSSGREGRLQVTYVNEEGLALRMWIDAALIEAVRPRAQP